jgi:hypothetical protein
LKDPDVQERLQEHCASRLDQLSKDISELADNEGAPAQLVVDGIDLLIRNWLEDGLREVVGRAPAKRSDWARNFQTREITASERVVKNLHDRWMSEQTLHLKQVRYEAYHRTMRAHLKLVARRKRDMYSEWCDKLAGLSSSEQGRMVSSLRRSKGRQAGCKLRTDEASLASYQAHFAEQFINRQPAGPELERVEPAPSMYLGELLDPIRIGIHIDNLARGKAAGNSGIPAEAIAAVKELIAEPLSMLFSVILRRFTVPSSWKCARVHPVPKKGDLAAIANYRPISLTEILRKLFEDMLKPILTSFIEPLSVEQGGFRARRGCLDQISALQEWICQSKLAHRQRHLAFLDIKAAYDQVDRSLLWNKCRRKGVPENLVNVLQALFDNNSAFVAVNGHHSPPFSISCGVLQGSLLSPTLYSLFIDDLIEKLNQSGINNGMLLGNRRYRLLLYADDIVLFSNSKEALQAMLDICAGHAADNRYRFNVAKCVILRSEPGGPADQLMLHDTRIPDASSFCYLGCTFSSSGISWKEHWKRLADGAITATQTLLGAGIKGRSIGVTSALAVHRSFIRPVLEYGLALCPSKGCSQAATAYSKTLQWMASSGQGASPDVIGLYGNMEPFEARRERLASRFYLRCLRLSRREGHYAVVDALNAHRQRNAPGSVFNVGARFPLVQSVLALQAGHTDGGSQGPGQGPTRLMWIERREELMDEVSLTYVTAFTFGGHDRRSRKDHIRAYQALSPKEQHAILLWCLNRATGSWKICRGCRVAQGTKAHVEECILGVSTPPVGPSSIEDRIYSGRSSTVTLSRIVADIRLCIGDNPIQGQT